jgi:hypothetical protein
MRAKVILKVDHASGGIHFIVRDPQGGILQSIDVRTSVLYLRSFTEGDIAAETRGIGTFLSHLSTEEEQLAAAVEVVGPLVAIGRPGDKLPQLGALRLYVPDEEWQATVTTLLTRARLVILRVARDTPRLRWELEQAARLVSSATGHHDSCASDRYFSHGRTSNSSKRFWSMHCSRCSDNWV